jgi:hypothetical protein
MSFTMSLIFASEIVARFRVGTGFNTFSEQSGMTGIQRFSSAPMSSGVVCKLESAVEGPE